MEAWQTSDLRLHLACQHCDLATKNAVHAANDLAAATVAPF